MTILTKSYKYREETENEDEEVMEDEEVYETFSEYTETLASSTFDTSNPDEHDQELDKKFLYYLTKRQAKEKVSENEEESD